MTERKDLLSGLNEEQRQAVQIKDGPLLIIAGAGSGKTKALTTRIAWLIEKESVNPKNILAVTFTNKAANEMKNRILSLLNQVPAGDLPWEGSATSQGSNSIPHLGTFHSICVRLLRKHIHEIGYNNSFIIYDAADQQLLIKRVLEELQIDPKQFNPRAILTFISTAKNQLIPPDKYYQFVNNYFTEKVEKAYRHYQSNLQKSNALDFDDIIMKTVQLLEEKPAILVHYQDLFKYICVDEYQDTNHAQYVLTNLLAAKHRNLCVIGDSDQSIYSFRGANIKNILDFEKDYPEAKVIYLEQNYRSTQVILNAAHSVIVKNSRRRDKKLWTERSDQTLITQKILPNERAEGDFINSEIIKIKQQNSERSYNDFVVLYRTNAQSRVLEESFLKNGIPYKIVGGIKFYERKEIKDLISYLRVLHNPSDTLSLLRIINVPARKIGEKTIEAVQNYSLSNSQTFWQSLLEIEKIEELRGAKSKALQDFVDLISKLQNISQQFPVSGLIKHIMDLAGYKSFLDDGTAEGESRLQNTYELISVASKYSKLEPRESLAIFLEEIALISDLDSMDENDNAVTLMTIHSSKGLEFPIVFLAGLEEGIFPHSRSMLDKAELEEERRLMYVALTRAKDKLYLLSARTRLLYGDSQANPPSQFLLDIPREHIESEIPHPEKDLPHPELVSGSNHSFKPLPDENQQTNFTPEPVTFSDEYTSEELHDGDRVTHPTFGEGVIVSVKGGIATIAFKSKKYGIKKLALSIAPLKKII